MGVGGRGGGVIAEPMAEKEVRKALKLGKNIADNLISNSNTSAKRSITGDGDEKLKKRQISMQKGRGLI